MDGQQVLGASDRGATSGPSGSTREIMLKAAAKLPVGLTKSSPEALHFQNYERLLLAIQQLSLARSIQEIADVVKFTARAITQADGATFILREDDDCYYFDEDAVGPLWKGQRFPMSVCISGWVMIHREAAVIPNILLDERLPQEAFEPTFVKSLVMVPVRTLAPNGAIGIYWSELYQATETEVQLLQALADSTSIAMENVKVYRELEERVMLRTQELLASKESLQQAHDKIQDLEQLVRMCAWTNRLEFDGEWVSIETYLTRRFGIHVSHGISKEAIALLHQEFAARKAQQD